MPLRNDLLNPIPGANPAGENLKYAPIYDKIKEARRRDDDAPQGEWARERKVADWPLTIKLISETLATKSKDLQLVAWLSEAMLRKEGLTGFREAIDLTKNMLEAFWESLYPELEDGDAELRAGPLQWVGDRLEVPIKQLGLTRKGLTWFQYKESRALGDEKAANTDAKKKERLKAIEAGKIVLEAFDKEFDESPKKFYVDLLAAFDGTLESLTGLGDVCDAKFGGAAPKFGTLRKALEEVRNTVYILLQKKRETEPDEPVAPPPQEPEPVVEAAPSAAAAAPLASTAAAAAAAPALAPQAKSGISVEPASLEDAVARLLVVAKFLRNQDKTGPGAYMMCCGFRWGELRAKGAAVDPSLLAAPSSEVRQNLKKLSLENKWAEVLEAAQEAAASECGRGWLDVHRYIARGCEKLGAAHQPLRQAVVSGVRALLADYPRLSEMTLMDDTATANAETVEWLKEQVIPPPPPPPPAEPVFTPPVQVVPQNGGPSQPDIFELAQQAARKGRPQEGIELLMREMGLERTGRARFQRKSQLAQLCVTSGHQTIAFPILQDLAGEIERRRLEDWESAEMLAQPLALLYKCLAKDAPLEDRQKLYSWICRLDPIQAMNVSK